MSIEIREVKTRSDLKKFIYLPAQIHKDHQNWVPPIYMDDFLFFDAKRNKAFDHSDTILLLAYKDGNLVGRIMGIIQKKYNEINNENDARFAFIETYDDKEVFHALIQTVEDWARKRGSNNIVGPLGFSDKDPQGFMIEGFDKPVEIATNANFPFMNDFIQSEGYGKKTDLVVYNVPVPKEIPPFYDAIYKRLMRNHPDFQIIEYKNRMQMRKDIKPLLTLLNETFKDIYAFVPFEEYEMKDYANRYIFVLDPDFVKAIKDKDGNFIAFIIGMADMSEGVKKSKGKMFPFGLFQIYAAQKRAKFVSLLVGGVKPEYRGQGLDVFLGTYLIKSAMKRGFDYFDSHLELENNTAIRAEMEHNGGKVYKRYRIYSKPLK